MNKSIGLCRAKALDGHLVHGTYLTYDKASYCFEGEAPVDNTVHQIICEEPGDWGMANKIRRVDIDPNTLCRFTGCLDKNGHMVYEGDKVKFYDEILEVAWDDEYCKFAFEDKNQRETFIFSKKTVKMCEVLPKGFMRKYVLN